MTGLTPAPWRWSRCGPDCYELVGADSNRVLYQPGNLLELSHGLFIGERMNSVDAKVIESAPDLLSALIEMHGLARLRFGNLDPAIHSAIERAGAIIDRVKS